MTSGLAVMAKKKATGGDAKPPTPERVVIVHLKGSQGYADWLDALSEETHIPKTTLFRVAMAEYAKNHGHAGPPSK